MSKVNRYPPRTSCFAFVNGDCTLLNECVCERKICRFYKTRQQIDEDNEKTQRKLGIPVYKTRKSIKNNRVSGH